MKALFNARITVGTSTVSANCLIFLKHSWKCRFLNFYCRIIGNSFTLQGESGHKSDKFLNDTPFILFWVLESFTSTDFKYVTIGTNFKYVAICCNLTKNDKNHEEQIRTLVSSQLLISMLCKYIAIKF